MPVVLLLATALPLPSPPAQRDLACERATLPAIHGVITVGGVLVKRAMTPVMRAACSCTHAGTRVRLVATLTPSLGLATARAPDDAAADACLQGTRVGTYEPFAIGSDCIDCGPRRFGVFHGSAPPPPPAAKLTIAFDLLR